MTEFRPFPDIAPEFNLTVHRWLNAQWPTLVDDGVLPAFFDLDRPWACLLVGPPATGKTLLAEAFRVLAGPFAPVWNDRLVVTESACCKADAQPGLVAAHVRGGRGLGGPRTLIEGYGRALMTSNVLPPDFSDFTFPHDTRGRSLCFAGVGVDCLPRAVTACWVREADGTPGALVRHLAWMGQ